MPTSCLKPLFLFFAVLTTSCFAGSSPAWLLVNPVYDDSVMTLSPVEKDVLVKAKWTIEAEGIVQTEPAQGSALLHRMLRSGPKGTDRMLESDLKSVENWKTVGFVEEGVLGFVAAADGPNRVPIVQLTRGEKRLWLVKASSQKAAEEKGWKVQGVQFWLWPADDKKPSA